MTQESQIEKNFIKKLVDRLIDESHYECTLMQNSHQWCLKGMEASAMSR